MSRIACCCHELGVTNCMLLSRIKCHELHVAVTKYYAMHVQVLQYGCTSLGFTTKEHILRWRTGVCVCAFVRVCWCVCVCVCVRERERERERESIFYAGAQVCACVCVCACVLVCVCVRERERESEGERDSERWERER